MLFWAGLVGCERDATEGEVDTAGSGSLPGDSVGAQVEVEELGVVSPARVVLNELHYDPDEKTERLEFLELVNAEDGPVDVSGWSLCDGVAYVVGEGTVLEAGGPS